MINIDKLMNSKRVEVVYADIKVDKEFVKRFRIENKLTQTALANILGVKKKTIEKWEQGVHNVGGSSAVLLKLLSDDPELIKRLYKINVVEAPADIVNEPNVTENKQEQAIFIQTKIPYAAARVDGD